jgi:hypothetical protein
MCLLYQTIFYYVRKTTTTTTTTMLSLPHEHVFVGPLLRMILLRTIISMLEIFGSAQFASAGKYCNDK